MRLRSNIALFVLILATGSHRAFASAELEERVDAFVAAEMQRQHVPGLALGVYRDGKILRTQGYGLANVELRVPVSPETVFQSASVGKQFTAVAVMMLVEQGKLSLEDPITRYLPGGPDWWSSIRVRHLLSHTSGLAEYGSGDVTKPGGPFDLRLDLTEDQLLARVAKLPMEFKAGDDWKYRDTNYLLLGFIIHKVTGRFYGDVLHDRVFAPLGMNATRVISEADIVPNRSAGYRLVNGELKNQEWVSPTFDSTADGTLYFTVLDLAKWDAALGTDRLLKRETLQRMWRIAPLNDGRPNSGKYGFGWFIHEVHGHRLLEHSGAWQGFSCHVARYPDDHLGIAVLTNLDEKYAHPDRIAHTIAGLYLPAIAPSEK